VNIHTH